jgi:hypothetical protein
MWSSFLNRLREISSSESEGVYEERVQRFKAMEVYSNCQKLRGWLETRWFPQKKVILFTS